MSYFRSDRTGSCVSWKTFPPAEFRGKGGPDLACITSGHLAGCDYRHPDLSSYVHQVQEDHLTFVKKDWAITFPDAITAEYRSTENIPLTGFCTVLVCHV